MKNVPIAARIVSVVFFAFLVVVSIVTWRGPSQERMVIHAQGCDHHPAQYDVLGNELCPEHTTVSDRMSGREFVFRGTYTFDTLGVYTLEVRECPGSGDKKLYEIVDFSYKERRTRGRM